MELNFLIIVVESSFNYHDSYIIKDINFLINSRF